MLDVAAEVLLGLPLLVFGVLRVVAVGIYFGAMNAARSAFPAQLSNSKVRFGSLLWRENAPFLPAAKPAGQ